MIKKLKRKFILLASLSMLILMTVLLAIVNIINYYSVINECKLTLEVISKPNNFNFGDKEFTNKPIRDFDKNLPHGMSPEVPYESRFFTVTFGEDGEVLQTDVSRIISVDTDLAIDYATKVHNEKKDNGFVDQFVFNKKIEGNKTVVTFLDCGRKLDSYHNFLWVSFGVGFVGYIFITLLFVFAAGRIVRPIADSYEKQKRFITDAGHEIKTPLTIISANVDLLESDFGESEELEDIRSQAKRLSKLTNQLVYLSKMEESDASLQKIEFPFSDLVSETVMTFSAVAAAGKKNLTVSILPNITINGAPESLRQLISILLDNAMKYSPEGGKIAVELNSQKKTTILTVSNTLINSMDSNTCSHVFDRFYRADASRNSETGGHGIGLSIAKAITELHGGKIIASATENDFKITVTIPQ